MEPFQSRPFEYPPRKPSLDSVLRQKRREQALREEQEQYSQSSESDLLDDIDSAVESLNGEWARADKRPTAPLTPMEEKLLNEAKDVSLVDHLSELRYRIIWMVLSVFVMSAVSYYFVEDILHVLTAPADTLYFMRPTEAFFTYLKVAMVAGCILASPVLFYHLWAFIAPALTLKERRLASIFLPVAIGLFALGIVFCYFLVLPSAIKFFIGFSTEGLQPLLSFGQYIDFVLAFILPFGVIFELPLIMTILGYFNLITSSFLKRKRKIFLLLAFVVGAVVSPTPDVFSQSMIALPMLVLYEVSLFIVGKILKK